MGSAYSGCIAAAHQTALNCPCQTAVRAMFQTKTFWRVLHHRHCRSFWSTAQTPLPGANASAVHMLGANAFAVHMLRAHASAVHTHLMASSWSTCPPAATAAICVNRSGAPEAKAKRVTPATSGAMRILWAKNCSSGGADKGRRSEGGADGCAAAPRMHAAGKGCRPHGSLSPVAKAQRHSTAQDSTAAWHSGTAQHLAAQHSNATQRCRSVEPTSRAGTRKSSATAAMTQKSTAIQAARERRAGQVAPSPNLHYSCVHAACVPQQHRHLSRRLQPCRHAAGAAGLAHQ